MKVDSREVQKVAQAAVTAFPLWHEIEYLYGIPNGGRTVAFAIAAACAVMNGTASPWRLLTILDNPECVSLGDPRILIVDDVYDSGRTAAPYLNQGYPVLVLYGKDQPGLWSNAALNKLYRGAPLPDEYVVFPWEGDVSGPEDAVRRLIQFLNCNPDDPSFKETPRRYLAWLAQFKANQEPDFNATTFDGIEYDGMVLIKRLPFTGICEHHLLPFQGTAAVAYIPGLPPKILGLSKLARIVQYVASRPQVQERMTTEIRDAVKVAAGTPHVGVIISAEHSCMSLRGPRVPGHVTITSALSGEFFDDSKTRGEFMELTKV